MAVVSDGRRSVAAQVFGNAVPVAGDVGVNEGDADGAVVTRQEGQGETFQVGDVAGDGVLDEFAGRAAADVVGVGGEITEDDGAVGIGRGGGDDRTAVGERAGDLEVEAGDGLGTVGGVVGAGEVGGADPVVDRQIGDRFVRDGAGFGSGRGGGPLDRWFADRLRCGDGEEAED